MTRPIDLARALNPCLMFEAMGLTPDPWQVRAMLSRSRLLIVMHRWCRHQVHSTSASQLPSPRPITRSRSPSCAPTAAYATPPSMNGSPP